MATILDLPSEIHPLIGMHLTPMALYACTCVCRYFYSAYNPCLWSDVSIISRRSTIIKPESFHTNAHHVQDLRYWTALTEDYYTIVFPRLRSLELRSIYSHDSDDSKPSISPHLKVQFARRHPTVRSLIYHQPETLPREFWETVEREWRGLESLEISGIVEADAVGSFWKVCDRVQSLDMYGVTLPESLPILSTLSFRCLRDLSISKRSWMREIPYQKWPLQLLEQVMKGSKGLRRLEWYVSDIPFPVRMVQEAFEEGYCPELCELIIKDCTVSEQDVAMVLRRLPARRLVALVLLGDMFGPLTYGCLREMYFGHLQELNIGLCSGATSKIAQEIMTECVHLVRLCVPYVFVRDIATAPKPWGCLKLEALTVYIAKQAGDEAMWEGKAFEQISKLRRLQTLDLQRDQHNARIENGSRPQEVKDLATLDLRIGSRSRDTSGMGVETGGGADIRCWSSLILMRHFTYDGYLQTLGMDELMWMTNHWKDLLLVCGGFMGIVEDEDCAERDRIIQSTGLTVHD